MAVGSLRLVTAHVRGCQISSPFERGSSNLGAGRAHNEKKLVPNSIAGVSYRRVRLCLAGTNRILVFSAAVRRLHYRPEHFVPTTMSFLAWSDTIPTAKIDSGCVGFRRPAHSGDLRYRTYRFRTHRKGDGPRTMTRLSF